MTSSIEEVLALAAGAATGLALAGSAVAQPTKRS